MTPIRDSMPQKLNLKLAWRASRPFVFPASIIPVLIGTATAWTIADQPVFWGRFFLCVAGVMLLHAGANMFNDYYDYKKGVDRKGTFGSSGVLTGNMMTPSQLFKLAVFCYGLALCIGLILWFLAGHWVVWLGIAGATGGFLYTGGPALKYLKLGDLCVFMLFGVLITLGSYYIQTGVISWIPMLYAIPIGLLIDGILHGNNLRDIQSDASVDVETFAGLIGIKASQIFYYLIVFAAFISIPVMILLNDLPWPTLLVVFSIPLAVRNLKMVFHFNHLPREKFAVIDAMSAQLQMSFGALMTLGIVLGKWTT